MRFFKKLSLKIKMNKKMLLFAGIGLAVIIAIIIGILLILNNKKVPEMEITKKQDAKVLSENFSLLFKEEVPKDLEDKVYIAYKLDDDTLGRFKINIKIPMLKLRTNVARQINSEITEVFAKKILSMIREKKSLYTIYNINFYAVQNDNILTLAIKCTLKEGKNAQRTILKTYNYDLENEKILTLSDIIDRKELNREEIQKQINAEIEKEVAKTEAIKEEGYNVYERVINDTMYQIDYTEEFMLDENGNLYIIYPYGNSNITGEMDVIVIVNNEYSE